MVQVGKAFNYEISHIRPGPEFNDVTLILGFFFPLLLRNLGRRDMYRDHGGGVNAAPQ